MREIRLAGSEGGGWVPPRVRKEKDSLWQLAERVATSVGIVQCYGVTATVT
jgi:hypothetical protein